MFAQIKQVVCGICKYACECHTEDVFVFSLNLYFTFEYLSLDN